MKNIIRFLVAILISLIGILDTYATTTYQDFTTVKLRHWYHYTFSDIFNAWDHKVWLNHYDATFEERWWDYNWWANPIFDWTPQIRNAKFVIQANHSMRVYISQSQYNINYHPKVRKSDNLFIKYTANYCKSINWKWKCGFTHIENQPYTIT